MQANSINFARMSESEIQEYDCRRLHFFRNLWLQARAANNSRQLQQALSSIDYFADIFPPVPLELNRHSNFASRTPHGHINEASRLDTRYGLLQAGHG